MHAHSVVSWQCGAHTLPLLEHEPGWSPAPSSFGFNGFLQVPGVVSEACSWFKIFMSWSRTVCC
jgi:hypothetical protein